jgi:hypothetical protein
MNGDGLDNPGPICCCPLCGWEVCAYRSRPAAEDRDNFELPELWARQFRGRKLRAAFVPTFRRLTGLTLMQSISTGGPTPLWSQVSASTGTQ